MSFDQSFESLNLPELVAFNIAGGTLTKVPKMFNAPKLRNVRFAYHPLEYITPFAFDSLPSLESLDLSGNAANPSLSILKANSLAFTSSNFTKLGKMPFSYTSQ